MREFVNTAMPAKNISKNLEYKVVCPFCKTMSKVDGDIIKKGKFRPRCCYIANTSMAYFLIREREKPLNIYYAITVDSGKLIVLAQTAKAARKMIKEERDDRVSYINKIGIALSKKDKPGVICSESEEEYYDW